MRYQAIQTLTYGEKIHKIDPKYIPQSSEVTNAIETHGMGWTDENVRTIIFSSNDIEWNQGGDFDTTYIELSEHIVADDEYIVSWEGVEYNLIASSDYRGYGTLGQERETPFYIYQNNGLEYDMYNYAWDGAQHITITHIQPYVIHPIDDRYVSANKPDLIVKYDPEMHSIISTVFNATFDEVMQKIIDATSPVTAMINVIGMAGNYYNCYSMLSKLTNLGHDSDDGYFIIFKFDRHEYESIYIREVFWLEVNNRIDVLEGE